MKGKSGKGGGGGGKRKGGRKEEKSKKKTKTKEEEKRGGRKKKKKKTKRGKGGGGGGGGGGGESYMGDEDVTFLNRQQSIHVGQQVGRKDDSIDKDIIAGAEEHTHARYRAVGRKDSINRIARGAE